MPDEGLFLLFASPLLLSSLNIYVMRPLHEQVGVDGHFQISLARKSGRGWSGGNGSQRVVKRSITCRRLHLGHDITFLSYAINWWLVTNQCRTDRRRTRIGIKELQKTILPFIK